MPTWNGHEYNDFVGLNTVYTTSRMAANVEARMTDYTYRVLYEQLKHTLPQYTMGICINCHNQFRVYREDLLAQSNACRVCRTCPTCVETQRHFHCNGCRVGLTNLTWSCRGCLRCMTCTGGSCQLCVDDTDQTDETAHCGPCCGTLRRQPQFVRNYSDRNYPAARPKLADPTISGLPQKPFLYLGVELEVEIEAAKQYYRDGHLSGTGNTIVQRIAKTIVKQHPNDVILKADSSIHHGFEVVTGPFSLDEHQKMWPTLAKNLRQAGCRSWNYPNTGIHIHLSRNWFSSLDLGKALTFMNSDKNRPYIIKIAGRDSTAHATEFGQKKAADIFRPIGRYEALNLTNAKTVEMRIFNGTINLEHILADIEFAHALANWVKEASMRDVEAWPKFYSWILTHRKDYQHLINFFTRNSKEDREDV